MQRSVSETDLVPRQRALARVNEEIAGCLRCRAAGHAVAGVPVLGGDPTMLERSPRVMLVGQAPGRTEAGNGRPFSGPAGRRLFEWLASVGIGEATFRRQVYMAAMTRCYPGPSASGHGDRRPSPAELALCRPFLDRQLALIQPELVILVGGMALEAFLGKMMLSLAVGRIHERSGIRYLPLPHPSGASTWLNQPAHRQLVGRALDLLAAAQLISPA